MKNDTKRKPMRVVLLFGGAPAVGVLSGEWEVRSPGRVGFRVRGLSRTFFWADEGKTWERAEETK